MPRGKSFALAYEPNLTNNIGGGRFGRTELEIIKIDVAYKLIFPFNHFYLVNKLDEEQIPKMWRYALVFEKTAMDNYLGATRTLYTSTINMLRSGNFVAVVPLVTYTSQEITMTAGTYSTKWRRHNRYYVTDFQRDFGDAYLIADGKRYEGQCALCSHMFERLVGDCVPGSQVCAGISSRGAMNITGRTQYLQIRDKRRARKQKKAVTRGQ